MTHYHADVLRRPARLTDAAGFTLVESMVALVVLSIGVIGTIGMFELGGAWASTRRIDDHCAGFG